MSSVEAVARIYFSTRHITYRPITCDFQIHQDILSLLVNEEPQPSQAVKTEPLSESEEEPEVKRPKLFDLFGGDVIQIDNNNPETGGTEEQLNKYITEDISVAKGNQLDPLERE